MPNSLTISEWERLKEAYVDAAVDAGNTLGALLVRLRALQEAEEGSARERIRGVREVVELATLEEVLARSYGWVRVFGEAPPLSYLQPALA
jgi:hypothetical protein